jgi:hypothetical protein
MEPTEGFLSILLTRPESSAYRSRDFIPLIKVCVPAADSFVQICGDRRATAYCLPIEKPPSPATKQAKITKSYTIFLYISPIQRKKCII